MGEAMLIKHLEMVDEVVPHLYTILTYHVNIDLGTCSCLYYVYTGKRCKHICAIMVLCGVNNDTHLTWLCLIDPSIFTDPSRFANEEEGRCEVLGLRGNCG